MMKVVGLALLAASASAVTITISPGDDFEANCLMVVQPGDTCYFEEGDHEFNGITRTHGTEDAPITITGDPGACIKGDNTQDRVLQIAHDYYVVEEICFDGQHGNDYVATAIYVLGADEKSTKNGVTSSVTGFKMANLEIKNFGSECVHFRYFVTHAEVTGCTIQNCGIDSFVKGTGGKVGEGIYLGCALDQTRDGKAPEPKLRTGSADNVDFDECTNNWIHHNTFRTYGNECVDVKEGSSNNLIEYNVCEQQKDPNSGCFGGRGSDNTFRWNEIAECTGAGIRVGGDDGFGEGNNMYGNEIKNCGAGAFNVMSPNQGTVCENLISGVDSITTGAQDHNQAQFTEAAATGTCDSYPGDLGNGSEVPEEEPVEEEDPLLSSDGLSAGVNFYGDAENSEPAIEIIETNESAGTGGLGGCGSVVKVEVTSVQHPEYADSTVAVENLFDGNLDTYFSVHRESTYLTFELKEETDLNGVAIGFFMKNLAEARIQTFDFSVQAADADEWTTVISRKESSGTLDMQTFAFSSRKALYARLETHGNTFNNWSAFTEVELCAPAAEEANALFGGIEALGSELEMLAGEVCATRAKLTPTQVRASGGVSNGNVKDLFDGNFETRWATTNTQNESDLSNDKVTLTFQGDMRISSVTISFYDGNLAHQYFSIYVQSSHAHVWTNVMLKEQAALEEGLQTFDINMDGVKTLYIVGNGNDIGEFSKFSEIQVHGC